MIRRPRIPVGERVYAIGDVHGCLDLMEQLVSLIRRDNDARRAARVRVILLGDLIDRGPQSAALVEMCRHFAERSRDFVVLKGNHEAMLVDALSGRMAAFPPWLGQGGDAALASWNVPNEVIAHGGSELLHAAREHVPADVVQWLDTRPLSLQVGDYLFVHAGIRPGVRLAKQKAADLLWITEDFLQSNADHSVVVIHGHSISEPRPDVRRNRIGIDTGAYRTGRLTALGLEGEERWTLATEPARARAAPLVVT